TVTLELFQPAAFGAGALAAEISGGVMSILTTTAVLALKPAWFTAVPVTVCFAPSFVTGTGWGEGVMAKTGSEQVKLTVRLVLFQPAVSGVGVMVPVILGGTAKLRS